MANTGSNRKMSTSLDSLAFVANDATDTITPKETNHGNTLLASPKIVTGDSRREKSSSHVPGASIAAIHESQEQVLLVSKTPSSLEPKKKARAGTYCFMSSSSSNSSSTLSEDEDDEDVMILEKEDETPVKTSKRANDPSPSSCTNFMMHERSNNNVKSKDAENSNVPTKNKKRTPKKDPKASELSSKSNAHAKLDDSNLVPHVATSLAAAASTHGNSTGVKRKKRKVGNPQDTLTSSETSSSTAVAANLNESSKTASAKIPSSKPSTPSEMNSINHKQQTQEHAMTKPTTQKKKKTFQEQVLLHMVTALKPFTLKTLASELRTTDIALHHLMLSLVDKGIVRRKEFGNKVKKELYWVDIESATREIYGKNLPSPQDMEGTKSDLQRILQDEARLLEVLKGMEMELSNQSLCSKLEEEEVTVQALRERVKQSKDRISEKTATTISKPSSSNVLRKSSSWIKDKKPSSKTRKQIKKEINKWRDEWKKRKEMCVDFIDNLSDAMEKRPKDVIKMLEVETDEMAGVQMPPKQNLEDSN